MGNTSAFPIISVGTYFDLNKFNLNYFLLDVNVNVSANLSIYPYNILKQYGY